MKRLLIFGIISSTTTAIAQPVILKQAIFHTTGTVVYKDEIVDSYTKRLAFIEDDYLGRKLEFRPYNIPKSKTITYVQNDLAQTFPKNRKKERTTTMDLFFTLTRKILEWQGNNASENKIEIHYTRQTKKIAGYRCKKAYVVTHDLSKNLHYNTVWYCPAVKLPGFNFIGDKQLFAEFDDLADAFDKVSGFIMAYTVEGPDGSWLKFKVTKIDTTHKIDESVFDIPKDLSAAKEKQIQNNILN